MIATLVSLVVISHVPHQSVSFQVGGIERTAYIVSPSKPSAGKAPIVFAFHGHGGNGTDFSRATSFHKHWPEAICIYPDGLPTPSATDPKGLRPGWQKNVGEQSDRDLALFDTLLSKAVKSHNGDPNRVFVAGFSNGGGFSYLLWLARFDQIRAIATCGSTCFSGNKQDSLKPKPAVVCHGKSDRIVSVDLALSNFNAILSANNTGAIFKAFPSGRQMKLFPGKTEGAPTLAVAHQGGHSWPEWLTSDVVKFFQAN